VTADGKDAAADILELPYQQCVGQSQLTKISYRIAEPEDIPNSTARRQ
jgi:hypothetical protein